MTASQPKLLQVTNPKILTFSSSRCLELLLQALTRHPTSCRSSESPKKKARARVKRARKRKKALMKTMKVKEQLKSSNANSSLQILKLTKSARRKRQLPRKLKKENKCASSRRSKNVSSASRLKLTKHDRRRKKHSATVRSRRRPNARSSRLCVRMLNRLKKMTTRMPAICKSPSLTSRLRKAAVTVHCMRKLASSWLTTMTSHPPKQKARKRRVVQRSRWAVSERKRREAKLPRQTPLHPPINTQSRLRACKQCSRVIVVPVLTSRMLSS